MPGWSGRKSKEIHKISVATLSSKGQITLPTEAREALGLKAQDRVMVRVEGRQIIIEPVTDFFSLRGSIGAALPAEVEDRAMQAAAADRR